MIRLARLLLTCALVAMCFSTARGQNSRADSLYQEAFQAYRSGVFELAEIKMQEVLELAHLENDIRGEAKAWLYIAEFRRGSQQLNQALTATKNAYGLLRKTQPFDTSLAAYYTNRKAAVYYELKEVDSALWYTRQSIHYDNSLEEPNHTSSNFNLLGACYREMGKPDSSFKLLKHALKTAVDNNDTIDIIAAALNLAIRYEHDMQQCDSTYHYANMAFKLANNGRYISRLYSIYNYLGASLQCLGDFEKALFFKNKEAQIKDSLHNENTFHRLESMTALHNLKYQEQKNLLLQEQVNNRNIIAISGSAIVLLLLGLLVYEWRRIRQIKQLMNEVSDKTQALEESNKLKDKMFSILAHDLRSPMSSLSAVLYLLKEDEITQEESDELIQQLSAKFQNTEMLLENLLDWSRLHIKGIDIVKTETNIKELFDKNLSLFEDPAKEKDITIESQVSEGSSVVDINVVRFIIRNLISNAIKFSNRGGKIKISLTPEKHGLRGSVSDNGIGIMKEQLPLLFSYDIRSTYGTNNERGTGLGLAMCSEYAKKHGGEIHVESEEGVGSTFHFYLKS